MRKKQIAAAFMIMAMSASMFTGCSKSDKKADANTSTDTNQASEASGDVHFTAGTYTATAKGNNGDVTIEVTFTENAIDSIKVAESGETTGLGDVAMESLIEKIVGNQTLAVDTVTGATNSSNALLTALEDCVNQAGGDVASLQTAIEKNGVDEEIKTQVVVVGGGASGTAAALQALENGSDVVLVEMTASPAGQGTQAGGMFATNSSQQKEQGREVDAEWFYDEFMVTSNYQFNGGLLAKVINNSGDTVDWLTENGGEFTLALPGTGGYVEHVDTLPNSMLHGYTNGGTDTITKLHKTFKKNGGTLLYSTTAKDIIMNEDGSVAGITCEKEDGGTLTINADAVILCTGGFGGNAELVAETFGWEYGQSRIATNIGTGIAMAIEAGADASYDDAITMHYGTSRGGTGWNSPINSALLYPWLHVNVNGERFMDESAFVLEPIKSSNVIKSLPQKAAYEIFDATMIETVAKYGTDGLYTRYPGELTTNPTKFVEVGHEIDTAKLAEVTATPTDLTETINELVADGTIIKADSAEELAELLDMDYLVDTINRYNELANAGEDTDHHKDAKYLDTLEGPLYAVKITPSVFLGTLGGIEINSNCEVVDTNGKPITGLFAAGSETNGAYGDSYVYLEGGTLGYAYGSGRIAGASAADFISAK